jgi:hypothetical protein
MDAGSPAGGGVAESRGGVQKTLLGEPVGCLHKGLENGEAAMARAYQAMDRSVRGSPTCHEPLGSRNQRSGVDNAALRGLAIGDLRR